MLGLLRERDASLRQHDKRGGVSTAYTIQNPEVKKHTLGVLCLAAYSKHCLHR